MAFASNINDWRNYSDPKVREHGYDICSLREYRKLWDGTIQVRDDMARLTSGINDGWRDITEEDGIGVCVSCGTKHGVDEFDLKGRCSRTLEIYARKLHKIWSSRTIKIGKVFA